MPENIRCRSCGTTVFGFASQGPRPVEGDECPECGGTDFTFIKE